MERGDRLQVHRDAAVRTPKGNGTASYPVVHGKINDRIVAAAHELCDGPWQIEWVWPVRGVHMGRAIIHHDRTA